MGKFGVLPRTEACERMLVRAQPHAPRRPSPDGSARAPPQRVSSARAAQEACVSTGALDVAQQVLALAESTGRELEPELIRRARAMEPRAVGARGETRHAARLPRNLLRDGPGEAPR